MYLQVFLLTIVVLEFCPVSTDIVEQQKGFCTISWVTRESAPETYIYTEYGYGYGSQCRYGNYCYQLLTKTGTRIAGKDVTHKRVECCTGYQKNIIHNDIFDCEPICEPECVSGHCTAPGNCTCSQGYKHLSSSRCVPSCNPECMNGMCISPGFCQCNEGYLKMNSSYCSPQCLSPCINGVCIEPDECLCNNGFEKKRDDNFTCQPICKNECINSICADINVCSCFDGYIKEDPFKPNVCVPNCTLECINGDCTAPDSCTCKEEYYLGNKSWNVCTPNCNCTNGYCLEPNHCICFDNYTLDEQGECEPICSDCVNATCKSPSFCECLNGFKRFNDTVCTPECSNCVNGICVEPEMCNCFPGYQADESGGCEPICDFGCANSICIAPNECSCDTGYEKIEENLCFPECSSSCSNCSESKNNNCLIPKRTKMITLESHIKTIPILRLYLRVNCSSISTNNNATYNLDSSQNNQWPLFLECTLIKSLEKSVKYLCFFNEMNYTYESGLDDILYTENLNKSTCNEEPVNTTVLLPKYLLNGEGSCELCAYSTVNRWNETLTLKLISCPVQGGEYLTGNTDNLYIYGGIAVGIGTSLVLIGVIRFFYRQKFKQYSAISQVKFAEEEITIMED